MKILMFLMSFSIFAQDNKPVEQAPSPAATSSAAAAAAGSTGAADAGSTVHVQLSDPLSIEDSLNMRDPFRRPIKFADPSSNLALPELERYSLDQLKIVGIITGPKKPKALVTTPTSKMFIVQEADRLGSHNGIVKKIKNKSIVVREKVMNLLGQEENSDTEVYYTKNSAATVDSSQGSKTDGGPSMPTVPGVIPPALVPLRPPGGSI